MLVHDVKRARTHIKYKDTALGVLWSAEYAAVTVQHIGPCVFQRNQHRADNDVVLKVHR